MSFPFLTEKHRQRYGRYVETPDPDQLVQYFHLDDADRAFIDSSTRQVHTRLGLALHLGTVRFLGRFRPLRSVPENCVQYLAQQLQIANTTGWLAAYEARPSTHKEHLVAIQQQYGYKRFNDQPEHFQLTRWLYTRAWFSAERPSVLFDLATNWLLDHKVLLPGVNTLARHVTRIRQHALERLWWRLSQSLSPHQRGVLQALLTRQAEEYTTPFEQLGRSPDRISSRAVVQTIRRLQTLRSLGVGQIDLSRLPPARLRALARHAQTIKAQSLERMQPDRQLATLLAFAQVREAGLQDELIDLFDALLNEHLKEAATAAKNHRLNTLQQFDEAALQLVQACRVVIDPAYPEHRLREAIFAEIPAGLLEQAVGVVEELTQPQQTDELAWLVQSYAKVRRYFPHLLRTLVFEGLPGSEEVLDACHFLQELEGDKSRSHLQDAPRRILSRRWRALVIDENGDPDLKMYTFCVMHRLQQALHHRNVFISPSYRWHDPRAKLLQGERWRQVRPQVCRMLGLSTRPERELGRLAAQLDRAYRLAADSFDENADVWVEPDSKGRLRLHVSRLDALPEPESLSALKEAVAGSLPQIDLPELLLEIHQLTGFADELVHISETHSRVVDLPLSVCAVLMSEACNIPLATLVGPDTEALTEDRLLWVKQHHIRAETLIRANARLVDAQAAISLAQQWGGGEVASVDGLRFVVPVRTMHAGYNRKYFGAGRGVTYINFTSDQFTGFYGVVVPGAVREAAYLLDGLLEHQTSLEPMELMSDSAGYTDVIFGLFWLLGYQFSPRLADIGSARFWRMDRQADYGPLNPIARHSIRTDLTHTQWDDFLRVAGSLKLGVLSASELLRTLRSGSGESYLTKGLKEVGRIAKTLFLLAFIHDEAYRRRVLIQLNRGESRHRLARAIFFGRRGELRKRYQVGQEDQLGALGLVTNMVILWNTLYMDAALHQLRHAGFEVDPEAVVRLSPLAFRHINFLGRYDFSLNEVVAAGHLRPLRNPFVSDKPSFIRQARYLYHIYSVTVVYRTALPDLLSRILPLTLLRAEPEPVPSPEIHRSDPAPPAPD